VKVDEFQIAVSIFCHNAIRFVDHLGKSMVTQGKGRNFMVFNNLAFLTPFGFFGHGLTFFLKRCLATLKLTVSLHFSLKWKCNRETLTF